MILRDLRAFPWWVSVVIGVAFYLIFAEIAPIFIEEISSIRQIFNAISWFGFAFLIPAAFSLADQLRGRSLLANNQSIDAIRHLHWQEFEELIHAYYRRRGYGAKRQLERGSDGGVDIRLTNHRGERFLVQCKLWRNRSVGVKTVRELLGVVTAESATGGIIIVSGSFTRNAKEFANDVSIELIDGEHLQRMLRDQLAETRATDTGTSRYTSLPRVCPKCGSDLVKRKARRGKHAGSSFYGCASYPKCRYTEDSD